MSEQPATPTAHNVFVYGSLLPGMGNYRLIEGRHADAIPARLAGAVMYSLGSFPGLVRVNRPEAPDAVGVVLTEIDAAGLESLDWLEGYRGPDEPDNFYRREMVTVLTEGGPVEAWVYFLAHPENYATCPVVAGGDWKAYRTAKLEAEQAAWNA